jgi:hypothetical protein
MELPSGIHAVVLKLVASIEVAESAQGVYMASQRAEGFVLGLETASAFKTEVIEALYIGFDTLMHNRLGGLRED